MPEWETISLNMWITTEIVEYSRYRSDSLEFPQIGIIDSVNYQS